MAIRSLTDYFSRTTSAAPLAVFRLCFGLLMGISLLRFAALGWIEKLYLEPTFHFTYYGFSWVKPLGAFTYVLFAIALLAAVLVALGYQYRLAIVVFFATFTYFELLDKTTYLNHYYFVSILSFLLLFLPAQAYFSFDARRRPARAAAQVPVWTIDAIKLLLSIVYIYAGLAKLNPDWLLRAQPLSIWLPARDYLPLIGPLLREQWVAYAFSWGGALYDLAIPFLLWNARTRNFAFVLVVGFHVLTRILFPIGMFPYLMIVNALIFFPASFHEQVLTRLRNWGRRMGLFFGYEQADSLQLTKQDTVVVPTSSSSFSNGQTRVTLVVLGFFFAIQILLPLRFALYPGKLFWTEQGYRFSWRVMLMEKAGYANFKIVDRASGRRFYVNNAEFINPFQEKQMATQPDFILEYAHYLAAVYRARGIADPAVYVESYVALNGQSSRPFIDPTVDLTQVQPSFLPATWILPYHAEQ